MTNENKTDSKQEPRPQAQEKSSSGYDAMTDNGKQEKPGKGKIATSAPGGSESDSEQD